MSNSNNDRQQANLLDQHYWNTRWEQREMGWDIGYASPAIATYMAQYPNKQAAILIPGCGNAYEAEYLVAKGFTNITLIDIAPNPVAALQKKFVNTPQVNVACGDFFHHEGKYDLMIEQTFFCAILPDKRKEYVEKAASLLNKKGRIVGLLFDKVFEKQGPPFGGSEEDYRNIFVSHFEIKKMEHCYNSIPARAQSEVFINLIKK